MDALLAAKQTLIDAAQAASAAAGATAAAVRAGGLDNGSVSSAKLQTSSDAAKIKLLNLADEVISALAGALDAADYLGEITALDQAINTATGNSGKWYSLTVAGTLSGTNAPAIAVEIGDRLLSDGSAWSRYAAPPTSIPDGSVVRTKLEASLANALTPAEGFTGVEYAILDALLRKAFWITSAGEVRGNFGTAIGVANGLTRSYDPATGITTFGLGTTEGILPLGGDGAEVNAALEGFPDALFAIVDQNHRRALLVRADGTLLGKIEPDEVVAARGTAESLTARLDTHLQPDGLPLVESWGEWFLRRLRLKRQQLRLGGSDQLVVAIIGDSWTFYTWARTIARTLITEFGDAGAGWCSFGTTTIFGANPLVGFGPVDNAVATVARSAGWVDTIWSGLGPDTTAITSSTAGHSITVTLATAATSALLHYQQNTGYGTFRYRWDAGAWTTVDADGADTYTVLSLAGVPVGATTLTIEVVSGTVRLYGVEFRKTGAGARVHRLGCGGGRTDFYDAASNTGLTSLDPDLVIVISGTNDMFDFTGTGWPLEPEALTPAEFTTNLGALATKLRVAKPLCDLLFVCPAQTTRTGPAGATIHDYAAAMHTAAAANRAAFYNLAVVFGPYADYETGAGLNLFGDSLHPNDRGDAVIGDSLLKLLL